MEKAINSDIIRGHIDTIILHTLLDGDKFAQQISETIESKSDGSYLINQATLYSSLKRLENLKYVTAYWNDSATGRRRYFKITENGCKLVQNNVSDWSYSRQIIDKLMNCPSPLGNTEEKNSNLSPRITNIIFNKTPLNNDKVLLDNSEPNQHILTEQAANQSMLAEQPIVQTEKEPVIHNNSSNGINYRSILNGLKNSVVQSQKPETTRILVTNESDNITHDDNNVVAKFNHTITTNENLSKPFTSGKVDLTEIVEKAKSEGYIIRVSSKDLNKNHALTTTTQNKNILSEKNNFENVKTNSVYVNKVRFFSSLALFFLMLIEFLFVTISCKNIITFSPISIVLILAFMLAYPITACSLYIKKPKVKERRMKADLIFSVLIVVFNLILVTFGANLMFNVDFSNKFSILVYLLVPIALFFDVVFYYVVRYILSKNSYFNVN